MELFSSLLRTKVLPAVFRRTTVSQAKKRFYKNVSVVGSDGQYEINLDNRKLKTPSGQVFSVSSYPLSLAVAAEWDAQNPEICIPVMHISAICNTVQDNPGRITKYDVVTDLLAYLENDTLLFRGTETSDWIQMQENEWDPIVEWFNKQFETQLEPTDAITGPTISPRDKEIIQRYLLSHNLWTTQAIGFGIEALKSVILMLAVFSKKITVEHAVRLSRLEVVFQTDRWGNVEWAHDLDKFDTQSRLAAASLVAHFSSFDHKLQTRHI